MRFNCIHLPFCTYSMPNDSKNCHKAKRVKVTWAQVRTDKLINIQEKLSELKLSQMWYQLKQILQMKRAYLNLAQVRFSRLFFSLFTLIYIDTLLNCSSNFSGNNQGNLFLSPLPHLSVCHTLGINKHEKRVFCQKFL